MGELFDFVDELEKDFGLFMEDCVCFFLLDKDGFEDGSIGWVGGGCEWWNDDFIVMMMMIVIWRGCIIEFYFFDMNDGIGHKRFRFGWFDRFLFNFEDGHWIDM